MHDHVAGITWLLLLLLGHSEAFNHDIVTHKHLLTQSPTPGLLPNTSYSPKKGNSRIRLSLRALAAAAATHRPCKRALILTAILLATLTAFWKLPDRAFDQGPFTAQHPDYHALAELTLNVSLPPLANPETSAPVEIWARGPHNRIFSSSHAQRVRNLLNPSQLEELRGICGRCLYHSLQTAVSVHGTPPTRVYVSTGDIDDQWLRDSAVQLAIYLPRVTSHPILKPVSDRPVTLTSLTRVSLVFANQQ
jgi:hypothetical protein